MPISIALSGRTSTIDGQVVVFVLRFWWSGQTVEDLTRDKARLAAGDQWASLLE